MKSKRVDVATSRQRLDGVDGERRYRQLARRARGQLAQNEAERVLVSDFLLSESADEEERKVAQPASDDVQEIECRVIGPMQVLEHDHRPSLAAPQDREEHLEDSIAVAFREGRQQRATAPRGDVRQRRERPRGHDAVARPPERFSLCSFTAEGFDENRLADAGFTGEKQQASVPPSGAQMLGHAVEQRLAFQEPHSTMVRPLSRKNPSPSHHVRPSSPALNRVVSTAGSGTQSRVRKSQNARPAYGP